MVFHIEKIAFRESLLSRLADDLLAAGSAAKYGDLASCQVILPSARTCRTLGHVLLEKSGEPSLFLPKAVTVGQLLEEEATAQGLESSSVPADEVRPLVLAHHLEKLPWLKDRAENAPGLAGEFIAFFDEARLHGRQDLLGGSASVEMVMTAGHTGAAEVLAADTLRLGEVWQLYRQLIPRDGVDHLLETAAGAMTRPRPVLELLVVAGFARLDPASAALIRAQATGASRAVLYLNRVDSPLSKLFVSTWSATGPEDSGLDPMAPSSRIGRLLEPEIESDPQPTQTRTLRQRLNDLGDTASLWAPAGGISLAPCGDQEQESLLVTEKVVSILSKPGGNLQSTAVVTNDPLLAARITAQLRDAGIDVDNTLGQPLSSLPAGLLLRFILRSALTGLRPEVLLEVLTHPYTAVGSQDKRREILTLNLERMLRSQATLPTGPADLLRLARERDEAGEKTRGNPTSETEDFVKAIVAAFQPLLDLAAGTGSPADYLAAMRQTWNHLAPEYPLTENPSQFDVTAADRLLDRLEKDQAWLPGVSLASFAADLNRLLSAANVPPHRSLGLPVQVAGLVEIRLERVDNLIIAGLNEGKFPTRGTRPLFFDSRVRAKFNLPTWKEPLARDAELFIRLLHNAPRVLLTWSTEEAGRPLLPSPFVERLMLGLPDEKKPEMISSVLSWRKETEPVAEILAEQQAFQKEPLDIPVHAEGRDLHRLSWTALRNWRDCPYRFLLERSFALRKEEEVQEEFGRRDSGNLIHEIMRDYLEPGGAGCLALASGFSAQAAELLAAAARNKFEVGGKVLPGRALWLNNFLRWIPGIVEYEIHRFQSWRPVLLEARFTLPLTSLVAWMATEMAKGQATVDIPVLDPQQERVILEGAIDRVDAALIGTQGDFAVIDYKTGRPPALKKVAELKEMQILLYTLAVEAGGLEIPGDDPQVIEAFYYAISRDYIGPPKALHFTGDRQLLLDGAGELVSLASQASASGGIFPVIPEERMGVGPMNLPCRYCDFRGTCRLEERDGLSPATLVKIDKLVGRKEGGLF